MSAKPNNDLDIAEFRTRLHRWREELTLIPDNQAAAIVELDQSRVGRLSRMDAMQQQAMGQASKRRLRLQIQSIDAALARIEANKYGDCAHCGETIAGARLRADPAVVLCIECATQADSDDH